MNLFVHKIQANPQDNGLYGMPLSVISYSIFSSKWECQFQISVALTTLAETHPDTNFRIEQFDNFMFIIDNSDNKSCIFMIIYIFMMVYFTTQTNIKKKKLMN
jgi:hypothetical protein